MMRAGSTVIPPSAEVNALLAACSTTPIQTGVRLEELLRRPQLGYENLAPIDSARPELPALVREQVEVEIKYEGYIRRQQAMIDEMRRLENRLLPKETDYAAITGLRKEAQEKLMRVRPRSVGQASRISGVSPADIAVLIVWLNQKTEGQAHD